MGYDVSAWQNRGKHSFHEKLSISPWEKGLENGPVVNDNSLQVFEISVVDFVGFSSFMPSVVLVFAHPFGY